MALLMASSSTEAWAQRPNGKSQESKRDSGNEAKESTQGDELSMAIGQTITLSAKDVKNWNESVPGVIDSKLTPDGKSIVLNARKTGSVTILLIFYDGSRVSHTVTVWPKLPNVVEKEVAQLVDSIPGVRRRRIGARVVLDGQVTSEAELRRIQQIATIYQGQVESLVLGPPSSTGVVSADAGEEEDTLIRVDMYFVQYDKRSGYQVGVGWPESLGATGRLNVDFNIADKTLNSATASLTSQPLPKLDMMSNRGWAKVLKHSTVVTQQGVEAHFQNGGEQLFSVNQGLSTGVERVGFGADVSVMPRFRQERGTLELRVNANVSELSAPGEGSRLPSRITSSLTTNVRLKLGQALILSGFRTKVQTHDVKGLPLLSEIPILGVFFGSHGDRENETEGAVFIIPSVVTTVPMHAAEFVNATLAHFEEFNGDIGTVNTYPKTPTIVEKGEGGSGKK